MTIHLYRHALSRQNNERDASVSNEAQAREIAAINMNGDYDLIICSPLKCTRQTLGFSNLRAPVTLYTELCREYINAPSNLLPDEPVSKMETEADLFSRVSGFLYLLSCLETRYARIAVVGHAYFFNTMRGVCEVFPHCQCVEFNLN